MEYDRQSAVSKSRWKACPQRCAPGGWSGSTSFEFSSNDEELWALASDRIARHAGGGRPATVFRQSVLRRRIVPIDTTVPVTVRILQHQLLVPRFAARAHKHEMLPSGCCTRQWKSGSGLRRLAAGCMKNRLQSL